MSGLHRAVLVVAVAFAAGCAADRDAPVAEDRFAASAVVRAPDDELPVRFVPYAVELEVGREPIAAWQVEIAVKSGSATLVGVEGGTAAGFREPPYYDDAALMGGRIVLAAFSTNAHLGRGRHRVAVIHVREEGPAPEYEIRLVAAGAVDGSPAVAGIDLVSAKGAER